MKKRLLPVLTICLCLIGACALAEFEAVIDTGRSTRLNLREEPTSDSESLGLFFSGTRVVCHSDLNEDWVRVEVGNQEGYMFSSYLKTGWRAERVQPRNLTGYTLATNWARVRRGPGTEYQKIGQVYPDDELIIWGETKEGWYYIEFGGKTGYISANLVRVEDTLRGEENTNTQGWKAAYRAYLSQADELEACGLIDVNGDGVWELAIRNSSEAAGCEILTYHQGQIDVLYTNRRFFTYLPGENLLCNSDGMTDSYADDVYAIQNGKWVSIASGRYEGFTGDYDREYDRYICAAYWWNGQQTTREGYMSALKGVYDLDRGMKPKLPYDRAGMMAALGD